jgi:hypothetical protein
MRTRALDLFAAEAVRFASSDAAPRGLAALEYVLTQTRLETLGVTLMGSTPEEQRAADAAAARGLRDPELDEVLGIGAMSVRDYARAETHLAAAQPHAAQPSRILQWRILAAGLAGDAPRARALARTAEGWSRAEAAERADWEWLAGRFGLTLPAHSGVE